jgi:hypothetical protein
MYSFLDCAFSLGKPMQAKIFGTLGRIAGLAGVAIGVLFLLYSGLIQYLLRKTADLDPPEAYAAFHSLTILIFGISAIGIVTWLLSRSLAPKTPIPPSSILALSFLVVFVLGTSAYVGTIQVTPHTAAQLPPLAPAQQQPAPRHATEKFKFLVCVGQYPQNCPLNSIHLGCGSSVEIWAKSQCISSQITKLADTGGNQCGYYVADVLCERAQSQ